MNPTLHLFFKACNLRLSHNDERSGFKKSIKYDKNGDKIVRPGNNTYVQ